MFVFTYELDMYECKYMEGVKEEIVSATAFENTHKTQVQLCPPDRKKRCPLGCKPILLSRVSASNQNVDGRMLIKSDEVQLT